MQSENPEIAVHLAHAHEYSEGVARANLEAEGNPARTLELMQERQAGLTSSLGKLEEAMPMLASYRELVTRVALYQAEIDRRRGESDAVTE